MEGSPRIIAILNQKGGVGKTTSAVNLGAALAEAGERVLLVDLDPQSNLSLHFGVEPDEHATTIYDLLLDPDASADAAVVAAREQLHFIAAVTELALVEGQLASVPDMQRVLARALAPILSRYDTVILDCPPSLGVLTVNALTVAHEVIVPMQAHYLALRGLEKLLSTVHLVAQGLNPALRVSGILLCMHESQSSHGKAVVEEMRAQFEQYRGSGLPWSECEILSPPIRRNVKLAEAPSFGQTIFDYAPQCAGAQDYRAVAASLRRRRAAVPSSRSGASSSRPTPSNAPDARPLTPSTTGTPNTPGALNTPGTPSMPNSPDSLNTASPVEVRFEEAQSASPEPKPVVAARNPGEVRSSEPAASNPRSGGISL
ncbi:MAG: ParA family protein [Phycisphaeraceae bacterium]|nr:ParA family protein [Phycisphaeraceae bacterium]